MKKHVLGVKNAGCNFFRVINVAFWFDHISPSRYALHLTPGTEQGKGKYKKLFRFFLSEEQCTIM